MPQYPELAAELSLYSSHYPSLLFEHHLPRVFDKQRTLSQLNAL